MGAQAHASTASSFTMGEVDGGTDRGVAGDGGVEQPGMGRGCSVAVQKKALAGGCAVCSEQPYERFFLDIRWQSRAERRTPLSYRYLIKNFTSDDSSWVHFLFWFKPSGKDDREKIPPLCASFKQNSVLGGV